MGFFLNNYDDAMSFINGFSKQGSPIKDLSRFADLTNKLGNPQKNLKFIHVAGTNGKGSTVRFCASALIEAGYKVGEFTSPFIIEYTDRIRINNKDIPKNCVANFAQIVAETIKDNKEYSQFEITTAIAFLYFNQENCDVICLETGIGGLVDSTNIVENTIVSIITSISYDHTRILGNTIEEIATQKAGIIKPNSNVILSVDNVAEVEKIVSKTAKDKKSEFFVPDINSLSIVKSDMLGSEFSYKNEEYTLKMIGKHQIYNAMSAIEALNILSSYGFEISTSAIKKGLANATVCARAEIVSENPLVIIDGAHNPSGAKTLADMLLQANQKQVVMIVGMLAEKNAEDSIAEFSKVANTPICVDTFHPGAIKSYELAEIFKRHGKYAKIAVDIQDAIRQAYETCGTNGTIVICGSLYLASELRKYL